MEGKEVRFGIVNSALYATITTDASCGCVNSMHDSFTPIGGMVPLVNMQMGELIFGGVGAGLYGMLMMVLLTVFIAGLMVGRTPEYLGKKVESREVRMVMLYVLVFPLVILVATGLSVVLPAGPQGPQQRRAARAHRDPVRVHLDAGQQRQRLRRPHRDHLLLQHHVRVRDADRALRDAGADAGRGGVPRREAHRARVGRHVPGHDAALRGAARSASS